MTDANRGPVVAVIPARGGSKGVPRKNLAVIAGRSLLARAHDAAKASKLIDRVVVSTEDSEIAAQAENLGATVVRRPPELALDATPTGPAVAHALEAVDVDSGVVVLLQPPAPLRTGADIDRAVTMLVSDERLDSVVSVYQVDDNHPARMYELGPDGRLIPLMPELETTRRQDLPPVYHRNGAIYAARTPAVRATAQLVGSRVGALVMPSSWTVNIDAPGDLAIAEVVVGAWDAGHGR